MAAPDRPLETVPALLEMRGIVKNYGAVRANRGIDLIVGERRVVGLLGENGSGKSTLMKVLFGMIRPDSGRVVFDGKTLLDNTSGHTPRLAMAAGSPSNRPRSPARSKRRAAPTVSR